MIHLTRLSPLRTLRAPHKPYHVSNRKQAFSTPRQNSHTKKSDSKKPPPPAAHHLRLHTTCDTQCTKPGHPGRRRKSPPREYRSARRNREQPQPPEAPSTKTHQRTASTHGGKTKSPLAAMVTIRADTDPKHHHDTKSTLTPACDHATLPLDVFPLQPGTTPSPPRNHTFPTPDHTATPP